MSEQRNARDQAIEVMARAANEHIADRTFQLDGVGKCYPLCRCGAIDYGNHRTEAVLDALLTARDRRPCDDPDCRNGWIPWGSGDPWVEEGSDKCPRCKDGTIDSGSLLLAVLIEAGMLERVPAMIVRRDDGTWNRPHDPHPTLCVENGCEPLYRVSPYE